MKNNYKIVDYRDLGLPTIEAYGDQFNFQDLYELVGKSQFMTTFALKKGSPSHKEYGDSVLGVIYYDKKSLSDLEAASQSATEVTGDQIRIDSPCIELTESKRGDLKYQGVNIEDIESISFLPEKYRIENYETGEKRIPGVIEVEVDFDNIDVDILNQNYLVSKHNSGTRLVEYEKEQLIGIMLAFNNGRINPRVLDEFGFTEDDVKSNLNIWMSLYGVKEGRGKLTEQDKENYTEIKNIESLEKFTKVAKELVLAGMFQPKTEPDKMILKKIFSAVEQFSPSILLHGKNQVYWDVDSYVHIALRHLKDYQVGKFKSKTPFPYKSEDLKTLIEKVLSSIDSEIHQYFSSNPDGDFTRHGKMAVVFNMDHYHIRIDRKGRLIQFHMVV